MPNTPLLLSVPGELLEQITNQKTLSTYANVPKGISTAKNERFLRYCWEVTSRKRWFRYAKGGGFAKWFGLVNLKIDYEHSGARLQSTKKAVLRNQPYYFLSGFTYTEVARGSLSVRRLDSDTLFDARSPGIFLKSNLAKSAAISILNGRATSLFFRHLSPGILLDQAYAPQVAIFLPQKAEQLCLLSQVLELIKIQLTQTEITEDSFDVELFLTLYVSAHNLHLLLELLYSIISASSEEILIRESNLTLFTEYILSMTGTPPGWYPLISGYTSLPELPPQIGIRHIPKEVVNYLTSQQKIILSAKELNRIKSNLKTLYEVGPGIKGVELEAEPVVDDENEDDVAISGAYIPIPTETFLEELSVKLQIHPISVYWLLEELRTEGVRCKPEEQRLLEDRLTVLVLRLLGHRWPKQIEAGDVVPPWADPDGIIPLSTAITLASGQREATLTERVRERLRADLGDLGAQQSEALLQELTGRSLDGWLRRDFFKRHSSQFKKRPIVWQLQSTPVQPASGGRRRQGNRQEPAFACLLYYHRCDTDILARLRTQYVEPLIAAEEKRLAVARRQQPALLGSAEQNTGTAQAKNNAAANGENQSETLIAQATLRLQELQDFAAHLRQVEAHGFDHPALTALLAAEPLDRWSGDGRHAPADHNAFHAQEAAWRVDINDGVRVNIAPLQAAGLLAHEVLNRQDVAKAIEDRARWRADERRWVRAGKLPRCGWLPTAVAESPQWAALAPAREAERLRLQEKRQQVLAELGQSE